MFKGAIFDLDGTLAYTLDDLRTAMNEMLEFFGYETCSIARILENINSGAREFVRRSLPSELQENEDEVDRCFAKYSECYGRHYNDSTYIYEGVADCIAKLKASGMRLGVLSNKQHQFTCEIIEKLLPEGSFEIVLGQGQFRHKPFPDAALYIAERFELSPEEIMFVGDSNIDMETARNSGMFPAGVTWGYRSRDMLIETGAKATFDTAEALTEFALGK